MRQGTDGNEIHPGLGDSTDIVQGDAAGGLGEGMSLG